MDRRTKGRKGIEPSGLIKATRLLQEEALPQEKTAETAKEIDRRQQAVPIDYIRRRDSQEGLPDGHQGHQECPRYRGRVTRRVAWGFH